MMVVDGTLWICLLPNSLNSAVIGIKFICLLFYICWDFNAAISRLQELALSLSLKCLSFDFVGTSTDESSEEFGTVQVCIPILKTFAYQH